MIGAIGIIEFNSIAKGYEVADKVNKAAFVDLIMCRPTCPGKFIIIISGDVEAVEVAIKASNEENGKNQIGSFVISNPHEDIVKCINRIRIDKDIIKSIGIVEHSSIATSMRSLDKALKSADVDLLKFVPGNLIGGRSYFILSGELSAVKESIQTILNEYGKEKLINSAIISAPDTKLLERL